jgi:hypothetical protein
MDAPGCPGRRCTPYCSTDVDYTPTALGLVVLVAVGVLQVGVAVGILWVLITRELKRLRAETAIQSMVQTFGAAQASALHDPRQLLVWHPIAEASRKLFPAAFAAIDAAIGTRFPFSKELVERVHAKVSSDWLAWEKAHDEEYRIKAAAAEEEIGSATGGAGAIARARLDRIQHEKIERYQQRYEEYVRTAKALQALLQ